MIDAIDGSSVGLPEDDIVSIMIHWDMGNEWAWVSCGSILVILAVSKLSCLNLDFKLGGYLSGKLFKKRILRLTRGPTYAPKRQRSHGQPCSLANSQEAAKVDFPYHGLPTASLRIHHVGGLAETKLC